MKITQILTEAQNYNEMFSRVMKLIAAYPENVVSVPDTKSIIDKEIAWAKMFLKRNDRVVLYLRYVKFWVLSYVLSQLETKTDAEETKQLRDATEKEMQETVKKMFGGDSRKESEFYASAFSRNTLSRYIASGNDIKTSLTHYISIENDVPEIKNFVWTNQSLPEIFSTFREFEQEWKERSRGGVAIESDDVELIKVNSKQSWWHLPRPSCDAEGSAMGHCGNRAAWRPGDSILSFRTKVGDEWIPHLTFILDEQGFLGEMKGRGNEKPAAKYHPAIIELLKRTDIVKGIKGGGYALMNNFRLSDLDEEDIAKLEKINPNLLEFDDLVKKLGYDDERVIERADKLITAGLNLPREVIDGKIYYVIDRWKDISDLVNSLGDDNAEYIIKVDQGEAYIESGYDTSDEAIKEFIDDLGRDMTANLTEWVEEKYPDFDPDEDDLAEYIVENDIDEVIDAVRMALDDGYRAGIESQMMKELERSLGDYEDAYGAGRFVFDSIWTEIKYVAPLSEIIRYISEFEDLDWDVEWFQSKIEPQVPYYGWDGYNERAALDSFFDNMPQ